MIGQGDLHFITFCCYQRRRLLGTVGARNLAAQILGQVRARYRFALIGCVLMPDPVHLLIGETALTSPAQVLRVFRQRLSRRMRGRKRGINIGSSVSMKMKRNHAARMTLVGALAGLLFGLGSLLFGRGVQGFGFGFGLEVEGYGGAD